MTTPTQPSAATQATVSGRAKLARFLFGSKPFDSAAKRSVASEIDNLIPAIEQLERENADLVAALEACWGYMEDLKTSNPGYLGKLCLQDIAQLNRACILTPSAIAAHKKGAGL